MVWTLAKLGLTTSEGWSLWDLSRDPFLWHLCKIAGMKLPAYSPRHAQMALDSRDPVVSHWLATIEASDQDWL